MLFSFKQLAKTGLILTVFLCLLLTLLPSLSHANSYNNGAAYFANGDYVTAISIWGPLAQQGHPAAQYSMGLLYAQGKGVKKNTQKARQLLTQAAEQDHLPAQFQLGRLYERGVDSQKDQELAIKWFTRAAENGYGSAQHILATHFLTGRGVNRNVKKGVFWLQKAAEQNDTDAMRDLGFLYFEGLGVKKDFSRAHDLLLTPAEDGNALAQFLLGELYATGGHGMVKNPQKAKSWYQQAKHSGHKTAEQRLLLMNAPVAHNKQAATPGDGAARFKRLNDRYYTLQIIQAQHIDSISKLTRLYSDDETYFFKIIKGTEALFVLVYGHYESYSEAKKAISVLPKVFQLKTAPWIRQVQAVKAKMP